MNRLLKITAVIMVVLIFFSGTAIAIGLKAKDVTVIEGGKATKYKTTATTLEEFIDEENIPLGYLDSFNVDEDYELKEKDTLHLRRAVTVNVYVDGTLYEIETNRFTVGNFLEGYDEEGFLYLLEGRESDWITDGLEIHLTRQVEKVYDIIEPIPFSVIEQQDADIYEGLKTVIQEGKDGETVVTYKDIYVNNERFQEGIFVDKKTVTPQTDKIVAVGTKPRPENFVQVGDKGFVYSKKMTMTATAYTRYDPGCGDYTASGTLLRPGVIAVDPKVIPLGTKVYVEGYGFALCEDTGGSIKGNKIDLAYESVKEALQFGRREVVMYIISE